MTAHAPERSYKQRLDALDQANRIRFARARLKLDIKKGEVNLVEVLENPPEAVLTMKVQQLLKSGKALGPVKVNKILKACWVSPSKTVGGLTDRQRQEIVSLIRR